MSAAYDSNEITRAYFDSLLVKTAYIDSDIPDTKMQLWGKTFSMPVMTAALSHLHKICPNAMAEYAKGAKMAEAVGFVGMGEDEEVRQMTATGCNLVKIIKPHEDNKIVFHKIEQAISCGVFAVGMDIDHAYNQNGGYDNVMGLPMKSKSLSEMKEFVAAAGKTPFVVKGVLSEKDAEKCVEAGAAAILVSHHHGIMPYSVPPLLVLPQIKKAVGDSVKIFVDCGIESGMDVYKALALGADAVCVGRNLMGPLENGAEGVAARLRALCGELAGIMARTGCHSLAEVDSSMLVKRNF